MNIGQVGWVLGGYLGQQLLKIPLRGDLELGLDVGVVLRQERLDNRFTRLGVVVDGIAENAAR